ncbi:hypothetical protein MBLNU457_7336t1 [Dothideomycetes sp. NU457]
MSVADTLPGLVDSIKSASATLPEDLKYAIPENGISLLDTKNEIFLSYLQTLALRNLEVIRSVRSIVTANSHSSDKEAKAEPTHMSKRLQEQMVQDLVRHRVYLEKGVRPLEERLRYQIDKVVRAAEDEDRRGNPDQKTKTTAVANDSEDEGENKAAPNVDELAYRPNPASFARPAAAAQESRSRSTDGVYRPPRITATAMPTTERREKREARPLRSATMDEFIAAEHSAAPSALPSIGSTIVDGGRRDKSAKEREREAERREYEETHLMRLPKEGKKEVGKRKARDRGMFGGEEWRGIGEGVDRIERLTKGKGRGSALDRSRKRKNEDGQRGSGVQDGGEFERRRKKIMRRL